MSELTKIWQENTLELQKYFATKRSFCVWMGQNYLLKTPSFEEIIKKAKKRCLTGNDRIKYKKKHNISMQKGQVLEEGIFGAGITILIVIVVFASGIWLTTQFIDVEEQIEGAGGTSGSIEIDEDTIEEIQENIEDFQETAFQGWDFDSFGSLVMVGIAIAFVALVIFIIIIKVT